MKVVLTGGGTGGHITPLLAVAHELKRLHPSVQLVYVGEHGGKFAEMTANNPDIDEIYAVFAGKFRRYHGESWLRRFFDVQTNLLNLRDVLYLAIGTVQAIFLMRRLRPDVVLLKGGFVGVPAGLASALWKIPFVTHDSDALPGLANRLVAKWAKYHATAFPADDYNYPKSRVKHVGVLVSHAHKAVSAEQQAAFKREIDVPPTDKLLLVTGGSSGAAKINQGIKAIVRELLQDYPDLYVVHQAGKGNEDLYEGFEHERLRVAGLLFPLYQYTGAADLVVTRAGGNAMAELGVQGRACVIVPNPILTGGHQTKNAKAFAEQGAAVVVEETTLARSIGDFDKIIRELLRDDARRAQLGRALQKMTIPDATQKLAVLLVEVAQSRRKV